jgi:hypothetical protein
MQYQRGSIGLFFRGDPNLLAWWDFEQGSTDKTGNGYTGTDTNIVYVPGKFGLAPKFNGTSSTITTTMNSGLNGDVTFMAWVNFASYADATHDRYILCSHVASYSNYWIALDLANGPQLNFEKYDGTNNPGVRINYNFPLNTWHLIVGVEQNKILYLYWDGRLLGQASDTTTSISTYSNLYIGSDAGNAASRWMNGMIDESAIFSRALSPQEISQYYRWATSPRPKYTLISLPPDSRFFLFFNN